MTASSTSDERYVETGHAQRCIRAKNRSPATIAEPAAATTSYTSGGAEYTQAGVNNGQGTWL